MRHQKHPPTLSYDELTTVRKNLQRSNVDVETDYIRETWYPIYRRHFLKQSLSRAYDCRKAYYLYSQHGSEYEVTKPFPFWDSVIILPRGIQVNCSDIVLFWRIQQVIKVTANALRQQIINREARRLDKEIKQVLDDLSEDEGQKEHLLVGKRVQLAEELSKA